MATAAELGFSASFANSIDAVTDRDFVAEFLFREPPWWACPPGSGGDLPVGDTEFGWVQLHDEFSTGSSIMPQKKNPDSAELARGKSGD